LYSPVFAFVKKRFSSPQDDSPLPAPSLPPAAAMAVGIFAASTSSVLIRYAQQDADSLGIATYRLGLASLILIPVLALSPQRSTLTSLTSRQWLLSVLSGLFLALHFGTWITSLEYTTVTSSVVFVQTTPLFVAVFSPVFLKESVPIRTWLGLTLALVGGVVIAGSDSCQGTGLLTCLLGAGGSRGPLFGDFLALAGGIAGAAYLIIGRDLRARLPLLPYITLVYGFAAIGLLAISLGKDVPLHGFQPRTYLLFLLLALFPQLLAHSTYNWALRHLSATTVSVSLLGEPISAGFLAYLFLDEIPSVLRLVGAAVTLAGIGLAVSKPKK